MSRLAELHAELQTVNQWSPEARRIIDEIVSLGAHAAVEQASEGIEVVGPGVSVVKPKAEVVLPEPPPPTITFKRLSADQVRQALAGAARVGIPAHVVTSALVGLETSLDGGTRRSFPADKAGEEERAKYRAQQMADYASLHGEADHRPDVFNPSSPPPRDGAITRHQRASEFWSATGLATFINENGLGNDHAIWDAGYRGWAARSSEDAGA